MTDADAEGAETVELATEEEGEATFPTAATEEGEGEEDEMCTEEEEEATCIEEVTATGSAEVVAGLVAAALEEAVSLVASPQKVIRRFTYMTLFSITIPE